MKESGEALHLKLWPQEDPHEISCYFGDDPHLWMVFGREEDKDWTV
jgi:hypothetical protein